MKKYVKFLSILLAVVLSFQILMPGAIAIEHDKLTVEKSASKGNFIFDTENYSDKLSQDAQNSAILLTEQDTQVKKGITPIVDEIVDLRTENTKHFRHIDGTYTVAVYSEPIHYKNEVGEWKDIDNSLVLKKGNTSNVYTTVASDFDISIPQSLNDNQKILVNKNGYSIGMGISNPIAETEECDNLPTILKNIKAKITNNISDESALNSSQYLNLTDDEKIEYDNQEKMKIKKHSSTVTYKEIFPDIDLKYDISSSKIKESIVINKHQENYIYAFDMDFGDLKPVIQKDGSIALLTNKNKQVYVIEAPYMYDSKNEISTDVSLELEDNNILKVIANADWINDSNRVFPVVIDPTITLSNSSFKDAYVSSASKLMNYATSRFLYAGKGLLGVRRTYLKLPIPTLPDGSVITNAQFKIKQYDPDYDDISRDIFVFDLTGKSTWSDSSITWNNQPLSGDINGPQNDGSKVLDYTSFKTNNNSYYSFNITRAVKNWCESGSNNGLAISTDDETSRCQPCFYGVDDSSSSNWPTLTISYNTYIGLEDYWPYETVDFGRSGTAYINDYNGSLTYVHSDLSMTGNRLPLNICHIFNSNNANIYNSVYSNMNVGVNFHLNIQEMLIAIPINDSMYNSGYRYKYYDGDGTLHYFMINNLNGTTKITHEYDSSVVLTDNGNNIVISDSQGNKKYFRNDGLLFRVEDKNGNIQTITFDGNKIIGISDPVGRTVTFDYNSSNQLISITDPANRTMYFSYDSSTSTGKLVSITYADNKTTSFMYSSNCITRITAIDNSYNSFSYITTTGCGKRISYVYQYGNTGSLFDYLNFKYVESNASGKATGNTLVKNKNGNYQRYLFDGYGRATEITNQDGQTQYAIYGSNVSSLTDRNQFNDLLDSSELYTISTNLLKNHGFERSDYWTALQSTTNGNFGYSTEKSNRGYRSMKTELNSDSGVFEIDQDFDAKPETTYTISVDINIPEELILSGNNGVMFGFVYCINGQWITDGSQWISSTSGWEHFSHTMTIPQGTLTNCHAYIEIARTKGVAYFDNIQVEESGGERYYNLVENSDFSNAPGATTSATGASAYAWTNTSLESFDGVQISTNRNEFRIKGSPKLQKKISQSVPVNAEAGDTVIIGGRAAAYATIDTANNHKFSIIAQIYSTETNLVKTIEIPFDRTVSMAHQVKAAYYKLETHCDHIVYSFVYYKHVDSAAFDNAFVYVGNYGTHYNYDNDGLIVEEHNDEGKSMTYLYENGDVVTIKETVGGVEQTVVEFEYDSNHNVITATNNIGTDVEFNYLNGQVATQTITENNDSGFNTVTTNNTYLQGGNYLYSSTDENGGVTTYNYDNNNNPIKGLITSKIDSNGNITCYSYDPITDELISTSQKTCTVLDDYLNLTEDGLPDDDIPKSTVIYIRENDLLKDIVRNYTTYSYDYDNNNRVVGYKIGNQTILTNNYDTRHRLSSQNYANGSVYLPVYDSRDRLAGEKWNGIQTIRYYYNENDRLSKIDDLKTGISYKYDYAFYDLPHRIIASDGTKSLYDYDISGNLALFTFSDHDDIIHDIKIISNEKGNPDDIIVKSFNNTLLHYNYDGIGRLTGYSNGPLIQSIEYNDDTSDLISTYGIDNRNAEPIKLFSYSYDTAGNIMNVVENMSNQSINYFYDGLNRVIGEQNGTDYFDYSYDEDGNITLITKNNQIIHNYDHSFPLRYKAQKGMKPIWLYRSIQ